MGLLLKERPAPLRSCKVAGLLKRQPSRLRRAPAIYRPGSLAARYAPPAVSGYDRERNVSFPSFRLMFPRCGVKMVCASVPSTAGVRFRIYLYIFCASPRVNPFGVEARDELGVRFGRQTAQLPALKRPRTRFEPRTAFFPPHRIAKKRAHGPNGRPAGLCDSGPLIKGHALREDRLSAPDQ
jgi:hypothetical protein